MKILMEHLFKSEFRRFEFYEVLVIFYDAFF